jgi:exodeoxyribonuclease V beta subunit
MFQSLLHCFDISLRLAQRDNSERRLTNLLHLAELLQQQSRQISGIAPLLAWLRQQFDENAGEEAELRLEDDEALVKIVTIHKSKGLQYPIVFVPFLWSCKQVPQKSAISFHDDQLAACIDLGSENFDRHWQIAEKERLAEDLRLLYVAVTRARSRVYLAWGKAGAAKYPGYASQTALAYLLHSRQTAEDLDSAEVDGFADDMNFDADIETLLDSGGGNIERVELPDAAPPVTDRRGEGAVITPILANFSRRPATQWRVNSFTALTRGVHQPANRGASGDSDDPILDFPAGSHVGLLLHSMLENLDFQGDIESQSGPLLDRFLAQAGLADEHRPDIVRWLENIMQTPLDGAALSRIGRQQRLDELEFDFALDHCDVATLNEFMQQQVDLPLQEVSSADFRGMINGIIDLVFEYEGRYYLADYKSNYLGSAMEDYAPERLYQAMLDRRYDLQSLLYALALHRLLAMRVADYDYARHFGGCYYLFLRALRPAQGNRYGVHFERPGQDTIERFDALFAYTPKQVSGL